MGRSIQTHTVLSAYVLHLILHEVLYVAMLSNNDYTLLL